MGLKGISRVTQRTNIVPMLIVKNMVEANARTMPKMIKRKQRNLQSVLMPKAYIYEVLLNVDTVKQIINKTSLISRPSLRIINKPVDFINKPCFSKCRTVKECRFVLEEIRKIEHSLKSGHFQSPMQKSHVIYWWG